MIRLNNIPNEGSTVKVNLGFRDSAGQYYIPAKITYTFLALNNDKESWSVVDNLYEVALTPASSVTLTIPDVKTITGTTLSRKVMVYWDAFVDNQYSSFTDEITFDIAPKPYIPNPPSPQPQPPVYVNINSVSLQIGTLTATPIMPVFIFKTNLPVKIDNASANIKSGDLLFPCSIGVDEGGGVLIVAAERELSYLTSYGLILEGLVSTINNYEMKEPFELSFVTMNESTPPYVPVIQDKKEVYINAEGEFTVSPDEGYDALHTVEIDVDLPIMDRKRITVTENGRTEIRPDANFTAMKRVVVDVDVPGGGKPSQSKEVTIVENGSTVIEPDEGYTLNDVTVNTDVPVPEIEFNKSATINVSEYSAPVHIVSDKDGMKQTTVTLTDIPQPKEEQTKEITVTENGVTIVEPDSGKVLSSVTVNTHVPSAPEIQEKEITVTENNSTEIVEPDSGYLLNKVTVNTEIPVDETKNVSINVKEYTDPVNITPDTGFESMEGAVVTLTNIPEAETKSVTITENGTTTITPDTKDYLSSVEVTTAIPLEENKTETLTGNGEHEIVPTTGNTAMKKTTVTVAVPIQSGKTETIEHNGTVTISPDTGYDGLEDVEVTVAVPLEDNKEETISVEDYSAPVEITPTTGNDGMEKVTVTLTNMTRLYVWKDSNASPNPHYMYTIYPDTSKSNGHAYQCGTTKNALLTDKNVEVNGEALYVSGYPSSLYYRDPDNDIQF